MGADIKGQTMAALPVTLDAMNEQASKACKKCGAVKLLSEFARHKNCRDGISPICRKCRYQQKNDIRKNNREKYRLSERKYREMNIDKVRAQSAAWYLKNKESVAARGKDWAKNNKEKRREQNRAAAERMDSRYVAKVLRMRAAEITPELIALKREQLTIRRLARQLNKATNESSKDTDRIPGEHGGGDNAGRSASDRGKQPAGAGPQGNQRDRRGGDGQGPGLDQQQPERRDQGGQDQH